MRETTPLPDVLEPLALSRAVATPYDNRSLARINDHEVRMSVMTHPFGWHFHPDSDEVFLALEGELVLEFESGIVRLSAGQMVTVPRGVRHRTRPGGARSVNLTLEKAGAETVFEDPPQPPRI